MSIESVVMESSPEQNKKQKRRGRGNKDLVPLLAQLPRCDYYYNEADSLRNGKGIGTKCTAVVMQGSAFCRWHTPPELYDQLKQVSRQSQMLSLRAKAGEANRVLVLPKDLARKYEIIFSDSELVSLKTDIAFIEARIQQVTERISKEQESRGIIKTVKRMFDAIAGDVKKGQVSLLTALSDLRVVINKRYDNIVMWEEVYQLTEQKRKLVETEARRMKDLQAYLTAEQALALVGSLVSLAREFVPDDRMNEYKERVGRSLKLTKKNFISPVEEVATALTAYDEAAVEAEEVGAVETKEDESGVFAPLQEEEKADVINVGKGVENVRGEDRDGSVPPI
jgi:hypothetical protein